MQVMAAVEGAFFFGLFNHVQAVGIALVGPFGQLFFPRVFLGLDLGCALGFGGIAGQGFVGPLGDQGFGNGFGIAMNANRNFLHQPEVRVIGFDLNDLGIFGPIVHAMLGQGSKGAHARTEGNDHVGLRN